MIADIRQPPSLDLTSQTNADQSQLLGSPSSLAEPSERPETLLRSLAIACELAKELSGGRKLNPALQMLVQTLVSPRAVSTILLLHCIEHALLTHNILLNIG